MELSSTHRGVRVQARDRLCPLPSSVRKSQKEIPPYFLKRKKKLKPKSFGCSCIFDFLTIQYNALIYKNYNIHYKATCTFYSLRDLFRDNGDRVFGC